MRRVGPQPPEPDWDRLDIEVSMEPAIRGVTSIQMTTSLSPTMVAYMSKLNEKVSI